MSDNPYQAPKAAIDLSPEPRTPPLIRVAYGLIVLYTLAGVLYTFLDVDVSGSVIFIVLSNAINLLIAWFLYQPLKDRKPSAWVIPAILLLLTIAGESLAYTEGFADAVTSWIAIVEGVALIGLLVIIFSPTGKAWLRSRNHDGF